MFCIWKQSQIYDHLITQCGLMMHVLVSACVFMNTVVQLNIPLSRHSSVLDQCYYSTDKKIWSDCPFKATRREASFIFRLRGRREWLLLQLLIFTSSMLQDHIEQLSNTLNAWETSPQGQQYISLLSSTTGCLLMWTTGCRCLQLDWTRDDGVQSILLFGL